MPTLLTFIRDSELITCSEQVTSDRSNKPAGGTARRRGLIMNRHLSNCTDPRDTARMLNSRTSAEAQQRVLRQNFVAPSALLGSNLG